jgi:hypothetical protein
VSEDFNEVTLIGTVVDVPQLESETLRFGLKTSVGLGAQKLVECHTVILHTTLFTQPIQQGTRLMIRGAITYHRCPLPANVEPHSLAAVVGPEYETYIVASRCWRNGHA